MLQEKVSHDVATADIDRWLDTVGIRPKKREEHAGTIDGLVEEVMYGNLVVNDDGTLTQTLRQPIKDGATVVLGKLDYKLRVTQEEVDKKGRGQKTTDAFVMIRCYACALTDQPFAMLGKLDTADYRIVQSVAVFFI